MCLQARGTEHNPAFTMSAASAAFSRFPSIPVEALADLDAVLDWSAKPMGQRTLSSILTAEVTPQLLKLIQHLSVLSYTPRCNTQMRCKVLDPEHTSARSPMTQLARPLQRFLQHLNSSALAHLQRVSCCSVLSEYPRALRC